MDQRIPVTLLTGFLGSGKTTLLNKLLSHPGMKNTAVIINELGETGLDHILAQNVESSYVADNAVLLQSGCVCCTMSNELADTMRDLFFKRAMQAIPQFNRLIIETTGMADPGPILGNLLNEPVIESVYRLDAVVVTIDAAYGAQQIDAHPEARKQAAVADVLLITKTDLATDAQVTELKEKLIELNPGATQHKVLHGEIEPEFLIDVGLFDPSGKRPEPERWLRAPAGSLARKGTLPQKPHADDIHSFTVTLPSPIKWSDFRPVLLKFCQHFGEHLLRLKGILHVTDQAHPIAVHAVHFTPYPSTLLQDWQEDEPVSRIVIIGKGLDEAAARSALTQF
ncbi:MAG TPA: GTP-binding protein [Methylophilus sp.]|nr:GTP-binding protein [Methylophilus sp.]HQQ34264.1 GTP-binding protein [Methylophilus sp.]